MVPSPPCLLGVDQCPTLMTLFQEDLVLQMTIKNKKKKASKQSLPSLPPKKGRRRHIHRPYHLFKQTKNQASKQSLPSFQTKTRYPNRAYHLFQPTKNQAPTYCGAYHLFQQTKNQASKQTLPSLQTNNEPGIQTDPTISADKGRRRHQHIGKPIISSYTTINMKK